MPECTENVHSVQISAGEHYCIEKIYAWADWNHPTRTRSDSGGNNLAEHLFINYICYVKYVEADNPSLPANVLKRSAVYSINREGKMKMEYNPKYEEGGGMLECEYIEAWSRKILVAGRSLGKGEDRDSMVLNRAVEVVTDTKEVEGRRPWRWMSWK